MRFLQQQRPPLSHVPGGNKRSIRAACRVGWSLILSALKVQAAGGEQPVRELLDHAYDEGRLELQVSDGTVSVTLLSEESVEVHFLPTGSTNQHPSFAIGTTRGPVHAELQDAEGEMLVQTAGLEIRVSKKPFRLSYRFRGRELLSEDVGYLALERGGGFRFALEDGERIYGGGSRVLGRMDRRGEQLELYNSACYDYSDNARLMYYSMPAVVSSRKYMLVFDNAARGRIDIDSAGDGVLQFDAVGGRMAYLVIAGDQWEDLATAVAATTGLQPMPPRWALGAIISRMGYRSQAEVTSVVESHIREDFPMDAVVLDLFWFGPSVYGHIGNLDWDRDAFPAPEQMMADFREEGVQTILVTEPLMLTESRNWKVAVEEGILATDEQGTPYTFQAFFGEAGLIDMFSPRARAWFWDVYRRHTQTGVAGWWGDLGEPETHPDDIQHVNGRGDEVHNAYGHAWVKLVYEGFRRDFSNRRPFLLMRSGFVGTQRYGILPWSGDVSRTWAGLKAQIEISLQMGLQGVGYMHSDLGGFTGDEKDAELYRRWMQYGVFQPIYRPHGGGSVPPEPIFWDDETKDIVRRSMKLRYRLLPYNYTLAWQNATRGLPLMRPLSYLDDRPSMQASNDTYLWGDAFLVAPVLEPGIDERRVSLPQGSAWFDYWSGKRYDGGQTITVPVRPENIPVLVKAGAFVPMIPAVQHTGEYDPSRLMIHYYADPSAHRSSAQFYDDDGVTPDAPFTHQYELLTFTSVWDEAGRLTLEVSGERHDYPGRPERRKLTFVLHHLAKRPERVLLDRETAPFLVNSVDAGSDWNVATDTVSVLVDWAGQPRTLVIE